MAKKLMSWKIKGMNKDASASSFSPEFAFENRNIRLATNDGNTMMSWVNEKGTRNLSLHIDTTPWYSWHSYTSKIQGHPIGTAVINHKLVLFTVKWDVDSDDEEYFDGIYVLEYSGDTYDLIGKRLFSGDLNFSLEHPLETLVSYESENVQKVYWTDNYNQPRVINIADAMDTKAKNYTAQSFNFVQDLQLKETVDVTKIYGSGEFPSGVIQYAFTYYNKYMQETNIFHTTPLQYISYVDRGGSPEDKIANSFRITVHNPDTNFDYLRIYSIMRTSKDATPVVKRVQDVEITNNYSLSFIDTGLSGEIVDPTELLYVGGEYIKAKTMEQKDGTLFLGNITVERACIDDSIKTTLKSSTISSDLESRNYFKASASPFVYLNTLDSSRGDWKGAACFKGGEYYRLAVQFQHKNGKWSEPCWIGDAQCTKYPSLSEEANYTGYGVLKVPIFTCKIDQATLSELYVKGYRKIRPLMKQPGNNDRTVICQGIGCPTLYKTKDAINNMQYNMASWLFRVKVPSFTNWNLNDGGGYVSYETSSLKSQFTYDVIDEVVSPYLSSTEIMGYYNSDGDLLQLDYTNATINSPDVEFSTDIQHVDFTGCGVRNVGYTPFQETYGDIDIQTSSPPIGSNAAGFVHRTVRTSGSAALISGLFYYDHIVDDASSTPTYAAYNTSSPPVYWPVFMWHKNGSLNNDVNRDNRSAVLLKKKISNYRRGGTTFYEDAYSLSSVDIKLFDSDEVTMVKVSGNPYLGNVDTMFTPSNASPFYFAGDPYRSSSAAEVKYTAVCDRMLRVKDPNDTNSKSGIYTYSNGKWNDPDGTTEEIGDFVKGLDQWREGVQIKYKSTPHLVTTISSGIFRYSGGTLGVAMAPIVEVYKSYDRSTIFGGTSDEALQEATWIPCGDEVIFDGSSRETVSFQRGDTYVQRYECLKTYAFSKEDKNQVVEIASFLVESRVNIDGRYDRNRGQTSNLNMSPTNFNLINPVYSQMDNFFSYKILPQEEYEDNVYPNTVTWTKTKQSGADVDLWTNITLASTLELDGNKGTANKLVRFNDQLLAFQDTGISQILYNENTQISTTEGVPIEIANSGKVQGKRYLSDTVGCSVKNTIVQTPAGIYFIDSNERSIYLFNGKLANISTAGGFNSWAKQNIKSYTTEGLLGEGIFAAYYDRLNQEVLLRYGRGALAFSERFNCFTSFYDYYGWYLLSLDNREIWVDYQCRLWQHQDGDYCNFLGSNYPFSTTLICNQEPQLSKAFTNLEFRACVEGEGSYDSSTDKFSPLLPFDTLEVWNEYQHGLHNLSLRESKSGEQHSTLTRKFRMWRCDIPRDNAPTTYDKQMGITRFKARPLDRIQNPWAYIKLQKAEASSGSFLSKTEVHDIMATYFA